MAANTVPVEMLREIFSYLAFTDLASVSLVCHGWYAASLEPLYETASLLPLSVMPFLRTILTPSLDILRTHVRMLAVTWESLPAVSIDPAVLQIFHAAAQHRGLTQPIGISDDSLVELILHLLPRVQILHLSPPHSQNSYNDFFGTRPTSVHLPLTLLSVRHLSCTWISRRRGVGSDLLLTMLRLPNIDRLEVHLLDEIDDPFPAAASATSAVSKLHISYSHITVTSLARILVVPHALQQLSFTTTRAVESINIDELYDALAPLQPTLEVLEVYFQPGDVWVNQMSLRYPPMVPRFPYPMGADYLGEDVVIPLPPRESFHGWPMLRGLRCPMRLLLGDLHGTGGKQLWEVLPRSMCELEVCTDLSWEREQVVEEFIELLHRKMDVVPCFRKAIVGLGTYDERMWYGMLVSLWQRLLRICVVADVELVQEGGFYLPEKDD